MIRNPIPWPDGNRRAVALTFDVDADSILHLAHREAANNKMMTMSMLRYDIDHIPVVREGVPVGIVARHDFLRMIAGEAKAG